MSIRRRLLLIVILSGAVLTGAAASIARLVGTSDAARVEAAESTVSGVAEAIATELAQKEEGEDRRFVARTVGAALSGARNVVAGVCGPPLLPLRAANRRDGARPAPLPADHLATISAACTAGSSSRTRIRGETLVVSVASGPAGRAWAALPVRTREGWPEPWKLAAGGMALATVLLVLLTLDAMIALERGASSLDRSLDALGGDLSAKVDTPRARELSRIADGLRRMAARLEESRDRERALSESLAHQQRLAALGRVAAGVAHEVRNPLAGMKLRLDLMKRAPELSTELREDVETCLAEIDRLDRLVRTILGAARKDPHVRAGVALGALVDQRIAAIAPGRVIRAGDATIATDPDLLAQIVDNLLRNAIEASDEVRAEITTHERRVEIAVIDRGPGVPEDKAAELFEPFFTTKGEGTGLGLFISRSLATALGGTLDYRRDGEHTRFVLSLETQTANA